MIGQLPHPLPLLTPPRALVADSFRRPDTSAPTIGASDGYRNDGVWLGGNNLSPTTVEGTFRILGGRLQTVTVSGGLVNGVTWNVRERDHVCAAMVNIGTGAGNQYFGLNTRYADVNNRYAFLVHGSGTLEIWEVTSGSANLRASVAATVPTGVDRLLVCETIGTMLRMTYSGVRLMFTNTTQNTGTTIGVTQTHVGTFTSCNCDWLICGSPERMTALGF